MSQKTDNLIKDGERGGWTKRYSRKQKQKPHMLESYPDELK